MATDKRQLDQLAIRFGKMAEGAARPDSPLMRAFDRIGVKLVSYIKNNKLSGNPIKRRTGNLSRHIDYTVQQNGTQIVMKVGVVRGEQDVPYAKWLEGGSRPHVITPKNARVLAFSVAGEKVFAKAVNHPGTPAFRFLRSSLQENRQMIVKELRDAAAAMVRSK